MSFKSKWKRFWNRLFESPKKPEEKPRGVKSSEVKGHEGVQSTLDKLNGK